MKSKEEILKKYQDNIRLQYNLINKIQKENLYEDKYMMSIYHEARGVQTGLEFVLDESDINEIDWENFEPWKTGK